MLIHFVHHQNTQCNAIEKLAEIRFPEKFCLNIEAEAPSSPISVPLPLLQITILVKNGHYTANRAVVRSVSSY